MEYAELVEAVVMITDRDELVPQIQYAIARATLKFHMADFFNRDIIEQRITPSVLLGSRSEIYVSEQLPGFRKAAYINGWDNTVNPGRVTQEFTENFPSSIRDIYGVRKTDVYYLAGDVITLWSFQPPPQFLVGYWKIPSVEATNYKSWIAEMLGFVIVDEASAEIFGSVGDADEAARRQKMFLTNLQIVKTNDIETAGR